MKTNRFFAVAAIASLFTVSASAQMIGLSGEEFEGVQRRKGDPSPKGGLSTGETNSRIDDYINQDEQINIDPLNTGVVKVLRTNQKALINDFVTRVIPIKNVHPREIRNVFRNAVGIEGGRCEVIIDKVKKENFVQVIAPTFMMPSIEQAILSLDENWVSNIRDGTARKTYYPKWRSFNTLDTFASNWGGDGVTIVDPLAGGLTRRDEPYRVDEYFVGAQTHDLPPPQALLRFNIYEITSSNDYLVGVDWVAWKNGPGRSLFDIVLGGQWSHNQFDNATGNFDPNFGAGTIVNAGDHGRHLDVDQTLVSVNYVLTSAYLDFLRVKGKARVVASPEIFALTNTTATWASTDQFLSFEVSPSSPDAFGIKPTKLNKENTSTELNGITTGNSDFSAHNRFLRHNVGPKNTLGLTLKVFASIALESAEVEFDFNSTDLAGTTPQGTPIISSRRLTSKVRMFDGKPVVLGSLIRDEEIHGADKAPGLGDIPVLGYLFGREADSKSRKEIVITCEPFIYSGAQKAGQIQPLQPQQMDTRNMAMPGDQAPSLPSKFSGFDAWIFEEAATTSTK